MRPIPALALLAVFVLAGCTVKQPNMAPEAQTPISTDHAGVLVTTAGGNSTVATPMVLEGLQIGAYSTNHRGGEPNIGATSSGAIFVTAVPGTERSVDHGKTWTEVFNLTEFWGPLYHPVPPGTPAGDPVNGVTRSSDPMMWVDPLTDRIFTDHMTGLTCSKMFLSDNDGATWTAQPFDCGIPGNDHQKVASGPWGPTLTPLSANPTYPDAVYYCYNHAAVAVGTGNSFCAVSRDGGLTFESDVPVVKSQTDGCGGINGVPAAAPDGTVYLPVALGCTGPVVGVSMDNGLTWTVRHGPTTHGAEELDPDVTVTPDGTAYMLWRGSDHLQYLARSHDRFTTWEGPWQVSPPDVKSTVFAGITSGDNGRIAMAYLGNRDTTKEPSLAPNATRWQLFETFSYNAGNATPTFTTVQVTSDADPVQIGCVWLNGGSNPCRNLLDFIDMTHDADGRTLVVYTDGCVKDCAGNVTATNLQSRSRHVWVASQEAGPSLFAAKGRIESLAPAT